MVSFTAYCPDGYYYEKGELHGASIEGGVLLSLEDCGSRCRNNRKCQSFEHNSFNNHCFLNNGSHPNSPRNTESLFCSKKGQLTKFRLSMISVQFQEHNHIRVIYVSRIPFLSTVDCEWKTYKRNNRCSMDCGAGTMKWTREKSVVESNGGVCPNENRMASGTTECYDCDKIGEQI